MSYFSRTLRACTLLCLLVFLSLQSQSEAIAQGSSDGSIYSRFGIGELRAFGSSQIQAMGGGGTAMPGVFYTNLSNPAAWGDQILTRASAGLLYQGVIATDAGDQTSRLNSGALNAVQFSFPLLTRKLGVGLSFEPYSRSNYRVQVTGRPSGAISPADTAGYVIDYEGRGGLQRISAGLGYRVNEVLSLGATAHFMFGLQEDVRTTGFTNPLYVSSRVTSATRLSGVSGSAGALLSFNGLLGTQDVLGVGAVLTLPTTLKGARVRTLGDDLDADTLGTRLDGSINLPLNMAFGAAYQPDARWTIVADGKYEPWSSFESDFELAGYVPNGLNQFRDRIRASAGVELLPAGRRVNAPFTARTAYRLGMYFDKSYVLPREGVDLRTLALTGGISLPSTFAGTRLDVNFEVGTRGSAESNLVKDVFYRISANVNIGERWFQRQRLR